MKLFDTMQRQKRELKTIVPGQVNIYSCGPTVYNYLHIGNWSAYIYWDVLVRTLKLSGYEVKWYMNITDVGHLVSDDDQGEDKLEKGAKREGKSAWDVAKFYTEDFINNLNNLSILIPKDHLTPATKDINAQIELIKKLEAKDYTYKIEDGIYFNTSKLKDYGKLARLDIDGLQAGARVDIKDKKQITDFALWKFSPKDSKRDMEWDSPWGTGFPGWHIECSAMSMKYLGETIDIHTGGVDHIPIHHTNEIAQSESATGKIFVNYWLHNNFMMINSSKISKSLENEIRLNDIVEKGFSYKSFRLMVLQSHYRTQSNFSWDILTAAQNRLVHWQSIADRRFQRLDIKIDSKLLSTKLDSIVQEALGCLQNDLDTPNALLCIEKGFDALNDSDSSTIEISNSFFEFVKKALGIDLISSKDISNEIKSLIEKRQKARINKNWKESDEIRESLLKKNIEIKDQGDYQIWNRSII